jgi:ureidoacrylate peracid hydrolase
MTFKLPGDVQERVSRRLGGRSRCIESLDPARTALIVVDMQNYFVAPAFQAACEAARHIAQPIHRLAGELRGRGGTVVWIQTAALPAEQRDWQTVYDIYSPAGCDARLRDLAEGSEGYALWPEMRPADGDLFVRKLRYSAFIQGASGLEAQLRARGIDTVLITGVSTNVCCESTARDAMMIGFRVIMVPDCLAAMSAAEHEASLITFALYFGDVTDSGEVATLLRAGGARSAAE